MDFDREAVLQSFVEESREGLESLQDLLLQSDTGEAAALEEIFRIVHTIKGNARMLGFSALADSVHQVESLLDAVRSGRTSFDEEFKSSLLKARDIIARGVEQSAHDQDLSSTQHEQLNSVANPSLHDEKTLPTVPADETREPQRSAASQNARALRVRLDKLDMILTLTSELAIASGRMNELLLRCSDALGDVRDPIADVQHRFAALFTQLQDHVMSSRVVSMGPALRRCTRIVRELTAATEKRVRVEIRGEEVEVDTSIVEAVSECLLHMMRNAVDHGIEPAAERARAGKDPTATISLHAYQQSGSVYIRIADDGRGLNRERLRAAARKAGVAAERLSDEQLYSLIFDTGFTTAASVTDVSGRGVGMDVVKRNIQALHGSIDVSTGEGRGTQFTIRLPLTVGVTEGFLLRVGAENYVLPLDLITECVDADSSAAGRGSSFLMSLRETVIPVVHLAAALDTASTRSARVQVVVVEWQGSLFGIAVDEIAGECQSVMKPLDGLTRVATGVSGSTILGNGQVAFILDVPALYRYAADAAHSHADLQKDIGVLA